MLKKEITITGKTVILAYCYATEISFLEQTGTNFTDFIASHANGKSVNPKQMASAVMAAAKAWSDYSGDTPPITEKDLIYEATAEEVQQAFLTVIELFTEFYHLPIKDKSKKEKGKGKN